MSSQTFLQAAVVPGEMPALRSIALVGVEPGPRGRFSNGDELDLIHVKRLLSRAGIPVDWQEQDVVNTNDGRNFLDEDLPYDAVYVGWVPVHTNKNRPADAWYKRAVQAGAKLIIISDWPEGFEINAGHFRGEHFRSVLRDDMYAFVMAPDLIESLAATVDPQSKLGAAVIKAWQHICIEKPAAVPQEELHAS